MIPLPTKSDVCRAAASFFAIKKLLNLCAAHTVEISWNSNLPCHKSKPLRVRHGFVQRYDFRNRLSGLRDHEWLAVGRLLDQAGQMGLCLMNVDRSHPNRPNELSLVYLVH